MFSRAALHVLTGIALVIVAAASASYASLGLAQALNRRREVGVRRTAGATRRQLMAQFWTESVLMSMLALIVGAAMAQTLSGPYAEMTGRVLEPLEIDVATAFQALALAGVVGLVAGC